MKSPLKKNWVRWCGGALAGLSLAALPARAFVLVPITMDFDPAGKGANRAFRVENDSDASVAVQISMLTRRVDLHGKETNAPAEQDFVVYPPQIALGPKQSQTIRVGYVGPAALAAEQTYRILAEQLPVALSKQQPTGARVNLMIRYLGSVYVVPKGAQPEVVLESVTAEKDAAGKKTLAVRLHNRGNAHTLLDQAKLHLTVNGKSPVVLQGEALKGLIGENILGGNQRRFVVPWPEGLADGPLQAKFEYSPQR
ncbi:MAG: molecular chaperone [Verrucomicrobia bacterium]|nr:molecular chaperone [Verrucomicrobiota bacterium]